MQIIISISLFGLLLVQAKEQSICGLHPIKDTDLGKEEYLAGDSILGTMVQGEDFKKLEPLKLESCEGQCISALASSQSNLAKLTTKLDRAPTKQESKVVLREAKNSYLKIQVNGNPCQSYQMCSNCPRYNRAANKRHCICPHRRC
jgi:hypothetical protein